MRVEAYHGSPGPAFSKFDVKRSGQQSGYEHARGIACFSSSITVAGEYAEGEGFIGRFAFTLENPLDMVDSLRPMGIASLINHAKNLGHDGVVLRNVENTTLSPGEPSDLFFLFDPSRARRVEVVQEGPEEDTPRARRR